MKSWFISLVKDWVLNKSTSELAREIREQDPAAVVAFKLLRSGASFMDLVKAYTKATANTDDDQVVADLMYRPFKDVLPLIAGPIGEIRIPDGDGEPENDISIGEFFSRVVDKVVALDS